MIFLYFSTSLISPFSFFSSSYFPPFSIHFFSPSSFFSTLPLLSSSSLPIPYTSFHPSTLSLYTSLHLHPFFPTLSLLSFSILLIPNTSLHLKTLLPLFFHSSSVLLLLLTFLRHPEPVRRYATEPRHPPRPAPAPVPCYYLHCSVSSNLSSSRLARSEEVRRRKRELN